MWASSRIAPASVPSGRRPSSGCLLMTRYHENESRKQSPHTAAREAASHEPWKLLSNGRWLLRLELGFPHAEASYAGTQESPFGAHSRKTTGFLRQAWSQVCQVEPSAVVVPSPPNSFKSKTMQKLWTTPSLGSWWCFMMIHSIAGESKSKIAKESKK